MKKVYLLAMLCAAIMSGCTPVLRKENPKFAASIMIPPNPATEAQLLEAAESVDRSLQTLAMMQESINPPLLNTAPLVTPEGGMGGAADIDWTGPIEPLLDKLTEMTNYRLKVLGNEPAVPIIITISQKEAVIADIFKNASLQAGKRAQIMVFPACKVVELRYQAMG